MFSLLLFQNSVANLQTADLWVTVVVILFTLSLIAERIANLIKLHIPSLREKYQDTTREKIRERRVIWVAVGCGLVVASIAKADFFHLVNHGDLSETYDPKLVPGIILTAFFISLGSKFWHDMLDIVMQFSNLKKYQAMNQYEEVEKTKSSIQQSNRKNIQDIAKSISPRLQDIPHFNGYKIVSYQSGNNAIQLFFTQLPEKIEEELVWMKDKMKNERIEIEVLIAPKNELYGN
ncbi:MAG: hypothetical protein AAGG68_22170 [Bacteroidota bacterium]